MLGLLLFCSDSRAGNCAFSDETFNLADWYFEAAPSNPPISGGSWVQAGGGLGDPDPFARITLILSGTPTPTAVQTFHFKKEATWDPSVDGGALISIDYSERARAIATAPNTWGGFTAVALSQGGNLFMAGGWPVKEHYSQPSPSPWRTISAGSLSQDHFCQVVGPNTTDCSVHPDFSETGSLIQFGFTRFDSHTLSSTTTKVSGIDNWSVRLTADACAELVELEISNFREPRDPDTGAAVIDTRELDQDEIETCRGAGVLDDLCFRSYQSVAIHYDLKYCLQRGDDKSLFFQFKSPSGTFSFYEQIPNWVLRSQGECVHRGGSTVRFPWMTEAGLWRVDAVLSRSAVDIFRGDFIDLDEPGFPWVLVVSGDFDEQIDSLIRIVSEFSGKELLDRNARRLSGLLRAIVKSQGRDTGHGGPWENAFRFLDELEEWATGGKPPPYWDQTADTLDAIHLIKKRLLFIRESVPR